MYTLNTFLVGHELRLYHSQVLASHSVAFDKVHFDFDESWNGLGKVALFWGADDDGPYASLVDAADEAVIPWASIQNRGRIKFGVYGTSGSGDNLVRATSTLIRYNLPEGAWDDNSVEPTPEEQTIIEQLLASLAEKLNIYQGTANAGKIMQVGADGNLTPTAALDGKVDKTQTINGKALDANITLDANDVPYDDDPEAEIIVGSVGSALFQRPQYNQVVRVDGEQSLTDTQKATARGNIGAASADDLDVLDIDQRLLMRYIRGTRQTATYVNNETIETVHTDIATGNVIRRDIVSLNYSDTEGDGIMETRNLYSGGTITDHVAIFSNLTTLETRISV